MPKSLNKQASRSSISVGSDLELAQRLGGRIREERIRLQLNQKELADKIGVSRTSETLYEAGRHLPRADVLVGLQKVGADVLYILTGQNSESHSVDLDLIAFALDELDRQACDRKAVVTNRERLDRAWPIYLALKNFRNSELDSLSPRRGQTTEASQIV